MLHSISMATGVEVETLERLNPFSLSKRLDKIEEKIKASVRERLQLVAQREAFLKDAKELEKDTTLLFQEASALRDQVKALYPDPVLDGLTLSTIAAQGLTKEEQLVVTSSLDGLKVTVETDEEPGLFSRFFSRFKKGKKQISESERKVTTLFARHKLIKAEKDEVDEDEMRKPTLKQEIETVINAINAGEEKVSLWCHKKKMPVVDAAMLLATYANEIKNVRQGIMNNKKDTANKKIGIKEANEIELEFGLDNDPNNLPLEILASIACSSILKMSDEQFMAEGSKKTAILKNIGLDEFSMKQLERSNSLRRKTPKVVPVEFMQKAA